MGSSLNVLLGAINFSPEQTGPAPYTAAVAQGLTNAGARVRVVTTFAHYPSWQFSDGLKKRRERTTVGGVTVERIRHRLPRKPIGIGRLLSEMSFGYRLILANWANADAVIMVSPALFATALGVVKARILRVPVITWVQDLYFLGIKETGRRSRLESALVKRIEEWVLRHSSRVVVIHDRFKREVVEVLGVDPSRVTVQRNWTHISPDTRADRESVRAALGWNPSDIIVLHAGNMGVKQGLENVIEAAKVSEDRGVRFRFVLLGDGSQREALERKAFGVEQIDFMSPVADDEFLAVLQSADFLLVNERPGISGMAVPSKLTSYFRAGVPVVAATDSGSVTEQEVLAAGAGISVRSGDPASLVDALSELIADPDLARFGRSAESFCSRLLSEEPAISKFVELIEGLGDLK